MEISLYKEYRTVKSTNIVDGVSNFFTYVNVDDEALCRAPSSMANRPKGKGKGGGGKTKVGDEGEQLAAALMRLYATLDIWDTAIGLKLGFPHWKCLSPGVLKIRAGDDEFSRPPDLLRYVLSR